MVDLSWGRPTGGKFALVGLMLFGAAMLFPVSLGRADATFTPVRLQAAVTPSPSPTPQPTPTPFPVTIDKDGFHPPNIRIAPAMSVTWTNVDTVQHTATAADGTWDTGPIDRGHSATLQFFQVGKWEYVCGFKPMLRAMLTVATPTPAPPGAG